jgi:hypothetical protein
MNKRTIAAVLGAAALALPAAAVAEPGHGKGHEKRSAKQHSKSKGKSGKPKTVTFVFKGTFAAPGAIEVAAGNRHVRKGGFVGEAVELDLSSAKLVVADTNADQLVDLSDVLDGDRVVVMARVAKGTEYAAPAEGEDATTIVVRKLVDKTNAPVDGGEVETAPDA